MDSLYQAVKNLLKAILNLFVAIIDLFANLINGIAFILGKLHPHLSEKYVEIKNSRNYGEKMTNQKKSSGREEELIQNIRNQLNNIVTGREKYYCLYAQVTENGSCFYAIALAILALIFTGEIVLCSGNSYGGTRLLAVVVMTLACAADCFVIMQFHKKTKRNRLVRQILEEEFKEKLWKTGTEEMAGTEELAGTKEMAGGEEMAGTKEVAVREEMTGTEEMAEGEESNKNE